MNNTLTQTLLTQVISFKCFKHLFCESAANDMSTEIAHKTQPSWQLLTCRVCILTMRCTLLQCLTALLPCTPCVSVRGATHTRFTYQRKWFFSKFLPKILLVFKFFYFLLHFFYLSFCYGLKHECYSVTEILDNKICYFSLCKNGAKNWWLTKI